MERRWAHELPRDPFYNPNLSLATPVPTPAFPPRVPRIWSGWDTEAAVTGEPIRATAAAR